MARGAFRPPRVPPAAQKLAGCVRINFEGAGVLVALPEKRRPLSPGVSRGGSAILRDPRSDPLGEGRLRG